MSGGVLVAYIADLISEAINHTFEALYSQVAQGEGHFAEPISRIAILIEDHTVVGGARGALEPRVADWVRSYIGEISGMTESQRGKSHHMVAHLSRKKS